MSVQIAWERHGRGEPLLLIHGLGYARWGWEPVLAGARRALRRRPLRQPRHRRERRAAGAVHRRRDGRATPSRCSTRPASSGRMSSGRASAGWSRRSSRSPYPDRVDRLVLACTTPGGPSALPDAAGHRRADRGGGDARAGGRTPPVRRERALAEDASRSGQRSSSGSSRTGSRRRRTRPRGRRRLRRARPSTRYDRLGELAAPTLVQHGGEDVVVDPRNTDLLCELLPDARLVALPRMRVICSSGSSPTGSSHRSRRSSRITPDEPRPHHRPLALRPGPRRPRPRRDPLPRRRAHVRGARATRRAARRGSRRARAAARRPARDPERHVARPRRDVLRLRAARRRAAADLVATRPGRDRLPARRRGACAAARIGRARGARAGRRVERRDRAHRRPDARGRRGCAATSRTTTTRCSSSTRPARRASRKARS